MPALARGQENTPGIINWFITVNGILTDAHAVGFRIFDITGGLPGTQVFPATPGEWESVTDGPGHFSVGSYYAYDNVAAKGYTPPLTATVGTHRIEWRWKITSAAPYQSGPEDFEVLVQSGGGSTDLYITIADVRAEGLDVAVASDAKVLSYIEIWQAFMDRACRQWFHARQLVLRLDGTDSDTIHIGVPIIQVDHLKLNDSPTTLDSSLYRVYNGRSYPDDRRNPRIKLIGVEDAHIYTAPLSGGLKFVKGRQNQEIKGIFGFVEDDGSTPKLIKRALLLLVIEKLTKPPYIADPSTTPTPPPPIVGNLMEEWTDGHKFKYSSAGGELAERKPGLTGITQNLEVLDIIKLYKAPIGIAAPAHPSLN
jgi:hypothetical protein